MSFGFKLMLTVVIVVGLLTTLSLYQTEQYVVEFYSTFMRQQFEEEVERFNEKEAAELRSLQDKMQGATDSVRLFASLEEGLDSPSLLENFYVDLKYEVRSILDVYDHLEKYAKPMVLFIQFDGSMFGDPIYSDTPAYQDFAMRLREFSTAIDTFESPVLGYFSQMTGRSKRIFYRMAAVPFVDNYQQEFWGALVFALPLEEQPAGLTSNRIQRGMIIENSVFGPDTLKSVLNEELGKSGIGKTGIEPRDYIVDGHPYLAFFYQLVKVEGFVSAYQVSFFSLLESQLLLDSVQNTIVGIGLFSLILLLVLISISSHGLTMPLMALERATEEIQKGNFEVRVTPKSKDEVGRLGRRFNDMAAELATKEKYRAVLDKVTDRDVADALINGQMELGGEVVHCSVVFCDIRGFTPLTENMEPGEVIEMLNEHMTVLTKVAYENNGVVDKFVGDEIMILFGAPRSYGNDALNAFNCAVAMIEERIRLNAEGKWKMAIGIGISTGEVVAGCMGSDDRLNYTVLGERVNLAARLCSAAGRNEIVMDDQTRANFEWQENMTEEKIISLKGFSTPIKTSVIKIRDTFSG